MQFTEESAWALLFACLGVLPVYLSKTNVNENVMAAVIKMVKKVFLFFNIFIHISGESDCLIRVNHDLK